MVRNSTILLGGLLVGAWFLSKNGGLPGMTGAAGPAGGTSFLERIFFGGDNTQVSPAQGESFVFVGDNTLVSPEDVLIADEDVGVQSNPVPATSSQGVTKNAPTAGPQVLEQAQADKAIQKTLAGGDLSFIAAIPEFQRTVDAIGNLTGTSNVRVNTTTLFSALQNDAQLSESIVVATPGLSLNDRAVALAKAATARVAAEFAFHQGGAGGSGGFDDEPDDFFSGGFGGGGQGNFDVDDE